MRIFLFLFLSLIFVKVFGAQKERRSSIKFGIQHHGQYHDQYHSGVSELTVSQLRDSNRTREFRLSEKFGEGVQYHQRHRHSGTGVVEMVQDVGKSDSELTVSQLQDSNRTRGFRPSATFGEGIQHHQRHRHFVTGEVIMVQDGEQSKLSESQLQDSNRTRGFRPSEIFGEGIQHHQRHQRLVTGEVALVQDREEMRNAEMRDSPVFEIQSSTLPSTCSCPLSCPLAVLPPSYQCECIRECVELHRILHPHGCACQEWRPDPSEWADAQAVLRRNNRDCWSCKVAYQAGASYLAMCNALQC